MGTQVLMPALSPTMTEGKLARWLKKVGDEVRAGDVIAEIETDKATMEVEAVDEGMLSQILVDEGTDGVAVNTPIAELSGGSEQPNGAPEKAAAALPRVAAEGEGEREIADRSAKEWAPEIKADISPSPEADRDVGTDTPDHRAGGVARRDGAGNAA